MSDIARDIQQLEALESDLRKAESLPQEIKEWERKIENRKAYIRSLYDPPKPISRDEIESELKSEHAKKSQARFDKCMKVFSVLFVIGIVVSLLIGIIVSEPFDFLFGTILILIACGLMTLFILACLDVNKDEKIAEMARLQDNENWAKWKADALEAKKKKKEILLTIP